MKLICPPPVEYIELPVAEDVSPHLDPSSHVASQGSVLGVSVEGSGNYIFLLVEVIIYMLKLLLEAEVYCLIQGFQVFCNL